MSIQVLNYSANDVVCREGDEASDLLFLEKGSLLVCTIHGTEVKAIAMIEAGEFFGELSFFDGQPRASFVVAQENCTVVQFNKTELIEKLPHWYLEVGKNLTKKIRLLDHVIHSSSIRKNSVEVKPLTIEEQRIVFAAISHQ